MDEENLKIIDLTEKGQGIARSRSGKVVFVPGSVPGDELVAKLRPFKKNIWLGENPVMVRPSDKRINPPCTFFKNSQSFAKRQSPCLGARACGGCQVQELEYGELCRIKEKLVADKLSRLAGLDLNEIDFVPILGMEDPWHYRNHVQLKIAYDPGKQSFSKGFFSDSSHELVAHDLCLIGPEDESHIWKAIKQVLDGLGPLNPLWTYLQTNWRELVIRLGQNTGDLLIAFTVDGFVRLKSDLKEELAIFTARLADLLEKTTSRLKLKSIYFLENQGRGQELVWGQAFFTEEILGKLYQIYPRSFFQVNSRQAEKMFQVLRNLVTGQTENWGTRGRLFDLYSGTGVIGLSLADLFSQTIGVEAFPDSVANARENAAINGIKNAEFYLARAEDWLLDQEIKPQDLIVVDPPRRGLGQKLIDKLLEVQGASLVYISCNPGSLASDLRQLKTVWQPQFIQTIDLFPWTMGLETVALLSKLDVDKHINIEIELDELDLTSAESKATYAQINAT